MLIYFIQTFSVRKQEIYRKLLENKWVPQCKKKKLMSQHYHIVTSF